MANGKDMGKLILMMAVFVVVAIPMVAYLWETLNDVLAFQASAGRVLIAAPVLAVFLGLLYVLARQVKKITGQPDL